MPEKIPRILERGCHTGFWLLKNQEKDFLPEAMTKHHLLSPYNWICGIFSKFVMVNSNDKKESTVEWSCTSGWVYLPFFQLLCFKQLVKVSVFSGSLTSLWPTSFVLYACLDFGPCAKFLFLSLAWVLSFYFFSPFFGCFLYNVWQGFITIRRFWTIQFF